MRDYYGWRARIGLIYPAACCVMEPELYAMAPEGVSIHTARLTLAGATMDGLSNMMADDGLEQAASLLAQAPLHAITFGGTSASFLEGIGYDQRVCERIAALAPGIPSSTTSTAALRALRALGAKSVSFVGPYLEDITERGRIFFDANGFDVTGAHAMGISSNPGLEELPLERVYEFARERAEPRADAVFISCTGIRTVGAIEALETDLGVPVVSANQATFWDALRLAGVRDRVKGFGSLFEHDMPQ